ncbi:hypothetical protein A2Y83_03465 [Candidatus Falkowbacteria bacterium RBG_13_39_14]|uniref:Uncharacterized protein n=1 Tax=Candidatus Falkowbacteria bacterium RBG_13_39_14 TaxID=1797985 RepID=A0A1F5S1E1_9BACT|nr:MAG: hypothetical protein A2Y83_03465 [Candidatus Falkowbacteria bacterium RBG_13_39_14]
MDTRSGLEDLIPQNLNDEIGVIHHFLSEENDEELATGVNVIKGRLEIQLNNPDIYYIGIIPNVLFKGVEPIAISIGDREIEFNNYIRQAGSDWNWHPEPLTVLRCRSKVPCEFALCINVELNKTSIAKKGDGAVIIFEILFQEPNSQQIITAGIIRKEVK